MKITGIVTEYNPFHLGHSLHLEGAKKDTEADYIIAIMSGNFVQRGVPAIIDKWTRAKIAVLNGVDLVVELPLIYSLSSAEGFAFGAVNIFDKTNVIDSIYFGSEHGNISELNLLASKLACENDTLKDLLKDNLSKGLPFHQARENALTEILPNINVKNILSNSNNILAIEYLKAINKLNSKIIPYTIKRQGANYNEGEINTSYPSATSIRNYMKSNNDFNILKTTLPDQSYNTICSLANDKYSFVFPEAMFKYLKYKLLTERDKLSNIIDTNEGLNNKILKEILSSNSFDQLVLNVKSKRYTYTRICRILSSFFIGLENYNVSSLLNEKPGYIRPLAFNENGAKILKEIKKKDNISIYTKLPKEIKDLSAQLDVLATKAYSILNSSISPIEDYLRSPILIK